MSLKAFHVVFIVACILLSFLVGAWGVTEYRAQGSASALALGILFYASGIALVAYALRFVRKVRELGI
jgi:hypothetical protein